MIKPAVFNLASVLQFDKLFHVAKKRKHYSTILSLHRISDDDDPFWPPLKVRTFKTLLEYCVQHYEVVHLSDLNKATAKPKIVLSFDDGYYDFIEHALPEIKLHGLPSNHNIVINCAEKNEVIWTQDLGDLFQFLKRNKFVGSMNLAGRALVLNGERTQWLREYSMTYRTLLQMNKIDRIATLTNWRRSVNAPLPSVKMMNWDDLKTCLKNGVEIGSHTVSHHTLTTLGREELSIEVTESKRIIEAKLGIKCETLAVPNGQSNQVVADAIANAGYRRLLLANNEFVKPVSTRESLNILGRVNLIQEPVRQMKLRMEGFHDFIRNGRL